MALPRLKYLTAKKPEPAQVAAPRAPEPTVAVPRATAVSISDIQASVAAIDWSAPRSDIAQRLRAFARELDANPDYIPIVLQPSPLAPPTKVVGAVRPGSTFSALFSEKYGPRPNAIDEKGRHTRDLSPDDIPFD